MSGKPMKTFIHLSNWYKVENEMNSDFSRNRGFLAAAVGAGVLLGAAGLFLYHQLFAERRRIVLQREVARLDSTVAEMREELQVLRRLSNAQTNIHHRRRKIKSTSSPSDGDSDVDMLSAIGGDDGEDEFFDLSDDETVLADERETDPILVQLFNTVDRLFNGDSEDKHRAYDILLEHHDEYPPSAGLLWRLAKASHFVAANCHGDQNQRKEHILQGISFAQQSLELDDRNPEAHKWFAVLVGSRGEFMGTRGRIEDGFMFKQHLDCALNLRPNDPSLHHLLGRFKYEVAMLSWLERKVAGTLFTQPPTATPREALENFLQAEHLNPTPWKENRLFIAKCYISQGNLSEAVRWLQRAAMVEANMPEDESVEKEIKHLLSKHSAYRKASSEDEEEEELYSTT